MADTAVASQQSNSLLGGPLRRHECQKLLVLRDEVYAGIHPRLGISAKGSEAVRPKASVHESISAAPLSNGVATTTTAAVQAPSSESNAYPKSAATPVPPVNVPSQKSSFASKLPTSGNGSSVLDPIFLTKSDDLVKAEMRLERQRIERSLEDQVKKQKTSTKSRYSELDTIPEFDVSEVFFQAQELVKPLAAHEEAARVKGTNSSSDSFDDNTFYSSQLNESGEEIDEPPKRRKTRPCGFFFRNGSCKFGDACPFSHDPAFKKQLKGRPSSTFATNAEATNRHPNSKADGRMEKTVPKSQRRQVPAEKDREHGESFTPSKELTDFRRNGSMEADRYSPPDAPTSISQHEPQQKAPKIQSRPDHELQTHSRQVHSRDLQSRGDVDEPLPTSHPKDVRVVRNYITSPIAPQPARVSPLAIAKQPRLAQIQQDDGLHSYDDLPQNSKRTDSVQESLNSPVPTVNSRKRRRDPDPQETRRNVTARRYIDSPDPYIKEEPMSPPPFTQSSTARQVRYEPQRREPVVIETVSPNQGDRVIYQSRYAGSNRQADIVDLRGPLTPTRPRVVSTAGPRYEYQEEPSLRRIVSARQPQRIQSPDQGYAQYPVTQQSTRAMSHSYIVRSDTDPAQNYRGSVQPQAIRRVQHDQSPSPQLQPIYYSSSGREATSMAPPPRRIVMDQDGNKYYEATVPVERRVSVAPVSRYMSDAPASREQPRKVSSQAHMADQYDGHGHDQEYSQRLLSPGPTSPRYVEYYPANEATRPENRQSVYQPREEAYSDRSSMVRIVEYPEDRLPRQYDQAVRPRETISRMQSVQPQGMQYEIVRERAPRTQSVRPDHHRIVSLGNRQDIEPTYTRQVSVRPDEQYVRAPSYVASERPRYQYVSEMPDGRFAREDVQDEIVLDGPRSGGSRQLQRQ